MKTQKRIRFAFAALIAAVVSVFLIGAVFEHSAPIAIVSLILLGVLVDSLWSGRINFGLRNAKKSYSREDQPVAYWAIVALYLGITLLTLLSIFVIEDEKKNEPNHAMVPTPVAVTIPAYAGTAPSTSAAHLVR